MKIKTIDIQAKEWFDRVYGNSYFSAIVTLNFGMPDTTTIKLPFKYGYGDYYIQASGEALAQAGYINIDEKTALWRYCKEHNIVLRTNIQRGCLKREVVSFVE